MGYTIEAIRHILYLIFRDLVLGGRERYTHIHIRATSIKAHQAYKFDGIMYQNARITFASIIPSMGKVYATFVFATISAVIYKIARIRNLSPQNDPF